ncbi:hypothetical protein A6R68_00167 [Neotoma lepida]|uniref:Uncharacterized protein n=1 Tax=Neotoma lepida TaxID=56216 RepID=A0A1A6GZC7_NEOLE|nr:hypothetical protein A6R68_00167 [Neotoma lepida]
MPVPVGTCPKPHILSNLPCLCTSPTHPRLWGRGCPPPSSKKQHTRAGASSYEEPITPSTVSSLLQGQLRESTGAPWLGSEEENTEKE